jgi:hypothetical protein
MHLGQVETVDIREVWRDEARDFTPWLAEYGLELLGEILGVELELIGTERRTGVFKADIVARIVEEEEERLVIIENQLEPTNHDHLGKVITYASGHDAATCVWIAPSFTDEHRQAMDWLNENMTDVSFFALEIGLIRIDDSDPAPQFKIISSPNDWKKAVDASLKKELSDVKLAQLGFWQDLKNYANQQESGSVYFTRKARPQHWYDISIGRSGLNLGLTINSVVKNVSCHLYMHDENAKEYFDQLLEQKEGIESELGYTLDWQRLDNKKASRIVIYKDGSIDDEALRQELFEWLFQRATEFYEVFYPRVQALR